MPLHFGLSGGQKQGLLGGLGGGGFPQLGLPGGGGGGQQSSIAQMLMLQQLMSGLQGGGQQGQGQIAAPPQGGLLPGRAGAAPGNPLGQIPPQILAMLQQIMGQRFG